MSVRQKALVAIMFNLQFFKFLFRSLSDVAKTLMSARRTTTVRITFRYFLDFPRVEVSWQTKAS